MQPAALEMSFFFSNIADNRGRRPVLKAHLAPSARIKEFSYALPDLALSLQEVP
jgi:hypothetical protein